MTFAAQKTTRRIFRITIQRVVYQITKNLLHQVFDPYGVVETIEIFPGRSRIVAFIKYGQDHDAARALQNLQGRNIYDGCCQLGIELLPVSFEKLGATNSAPGTQQAVTEVLQQEEKTAAAQLSSVAAAAVGAGEITAAMLAAAGVRQEEAPETPQETGSAQTQLSTDEGASAAESSAAAASTLVGKSSCDVHGVHAIFRSYLSDWKEKHDSYSTCMRTKPDGIRIGPSCCSFHKTENSFGLRPPEECDQGVANDTWDQGNMETILLPIEIQRDGNGCFNYSWERNWSHRIPSLRSYEGLQPWPPPCSLRTSCLSRRGVVLWTWVYGIKAGAAAWKESMRENYSKSPLGKYRIRKESNCIRKDLDLIVLGEVKGLNIHYIRMTCIYVGDKQEQSI